MAPRFVRLDDIQHEIREHAKQFQKRAAEKQVAAVPQPVTGQLRVKQVAGPGEYPLVPSHPLYRAD